MLDQHCWLDARKSRVCTRFLLPAVCLSGDAVQPVEMATSRLRGMRLPGCTVRKERHQSIFNAQADDAKPGQLGHCNTPDSAM